MLYLVSTPIGNLSDITFRAVEILKSVELIVSEDTRKTSILLKHYGISKPQLAYNNFNEHSLTEKIVEKLIKGEDIALVTSAGTPGISDPGYLLVHAAVSNDVPVTAIPGANAAITALIISDLPAHSFMFRGFPPHKSGPRKRFFAQDKDSTVTQIYYESPYRLQVFLKDALDILGNRKVVIANDLTKKFERLYRGNIEEMIEMFNSEKIRGEYTIVINGKSELQDPKI